MPIHVEETKFIQNKSESDRESDESDVEPLDQEKNHILKQPRMYQKSTQIPEHADMEEEEEDQDDGWKTGGRAPAMSKENLKYYLKCDDFCCFQSLAKSCYDR